MDKVSCMATQTYARCLRWLTTGLLLAVGLAPDLARSTAEAEPPGQINFACSAQADSPEFAMALRLYQQAFASLDFNFTMYFAPPRRGQAELLSGKADGHCGDLAGLELTSDQVIRLELALLVTEANAYTYEAALRASTPDALFSAGPAVGVLRGGASLESLLQPWPQIDRLRVDDMAQGLKMLAAGRIQLLVVPSVLLNSHLQRNNVERPWIAATLQRYTLYPYLHRRHQALAPALTQALARTLSAPDNPLRPLQGQGDRPDR